VTPNRILLLSTIALVTGLVGAPLSAQEPAPDPDAFVTMPDDYYAEQERLDLEERRARGDIKNYPGYVPGYRTMAGLGLSPTAPAVSPSLLSLMATAPGNRIFDRTPRFEFHGYLQPVVRLGIGAGEGGNGTTLHADPVAPGAAWGWFDHTNTVPSPWAQLNFRYGSDVVSATAIIGAWSVSEADEAAGSFMGHAQVLFSDVYLTWTPDVEPVKLTIHAGAFPDKYGFMSKYHQGAYGASLIGDIYGMGATASAMFPFVGDFDVTIEGGFKGELDKAPLGTPLDGASENARAEEGATFAGHAHMAIRLAEHFTPAAHFIHSWSQDDRKDLPDDPWTTANETQSRKDGSLTILGGDLRVDGGRFGYLYLGASHVIGQHANSLTNLVKVINTGSGADFNRHFWGFESDGNGTLTLAGLQYTLSLGTLLRHPMPFWGVGPDLILDLFGMYGWATSDAPDRADRNMVKFGTQATYSFSKLMAAGLRIDYVAPDMSDRHRSFAIFSPRITFRSDWTTRESLTIQYSYYATGHRVVANGDNRLSNISSNSPDHHTVSVLGTIWW